MVDEAKSRFCIYLAGFDWRSKNTNSIEERSIDKLQFGAESGVDEVTSDEWNRRCCNLLPPRHSAIIKPSFNRDQFFRFMKPSSKRKRDREPVEGGISNPPGNVFKRQRLDGNFRGAYVEASHNGVNLQLFNN